MIHIDSEKGTLQFSGRLPIIQAELTAALREYRTHIDPEHGEELIDEIVRVSKLTEEEMNKEVVDRLLENMDLDGLMRLRKDLSKLSSLLDKVNTSGEKIDRDTFESMFGDILNNKDGNNKKNKKGE